MKRAFWIPIICAVILSSCLPVDLDAPIPTFDTGVDPESWALVAAGTFYHGQKADQEEIPYDYEIMVTDVTVTQFIDFLNAGIADGLLSIDTDQITVFYPGDEYRAYEHEIEIGPDDYIVVPLNDPVSRFKLDDDSLSVKAGYENHPMTNVSWFGAWAYCAYYEYRLPTEFEWEKAARGAEDDRPFPWGDEIMRENANFYASRDPFEDMASFGSRTSPVGFFNGQIYDGYETQDSASPYGLYDMAGNVWQWIGDIIPDFSDRFLRGGSKDTYDMDLRIWVRNSAPPMYFSPGVGFRCVRIP